MHNPEESMVIPIPHKPGATDDIEQILWAGNRESPG
jgi:hypothetical protein